MKEIMLKLKELECSAAHTSPRGQQKKLGAHIDQVGLWSNTC
jgi:hypothetical protein